ncbi:MAG: hypothetical protein HWQ38_18815 [Nostoc sp. NMS7]|nr:hypothetical protein [Nostoc sp. NMS7]
MVRAILEGRKTQTRRVRSLEIINQSPDSFKFESLSSEKIKKDLVVIANFTQSTGKLLRIPYIRCPYGKPQDLFWVRETWRQALSETHECYAYRADMTYQCGKPMPPNDYSTVGWKPSIHMKKAIARIWLECTSIGVERLQDITDEGAIAEGVERHSLDESKWRSYLYPKEPWAYTVSAKESFESLWKSINGVESWDKNDWVWVVGIKKITKTGVSL